MSAVADVKLSTIIESAVTLKTSDAAIGVDGTFGPDGVIRPGVYSWSDRSGGISIGYPQLTISVRRPSQASRVWKVTAKLVRPTLEQTSPSTATGIQPAPTKAYDCTCVMEFMLPERSTNTERLSLLNNVFGLFATTITASDASPSDSTGTPLRAAVLSFEPPY